MVNVIGGLINEAGCRTYIVNGTEDHMHCLFSLKSSISLSNLMKNVKAKSSKWANESKLIDCRFEWQRGFGAFSYDKKVIVSIYKYIQNQQIHHRTTPFLDEYSEILDKYDMDTSHKEKYIYDELQ
jgi:REP element-mobilizing transposase RayT